MNHPLLQQIKEHTKENHLSLEQQPLLSALTASDLDHSLYLKILIKFYGFFSPLEKAINAFPEIHEFLPDFQNRRKASALLQDIEEVSKQNNIKPVIEECKNLPSITNSAEAFGCLYVMEGSTLGGRMIYKNLEKNLKMSCGEGASFFFGYGSETGDKWKKFQTGLSSFAEKKPNEAQDSIMAAADTFDKLEVWFNKKI